MIGLNEILLKLCNWTWVFHGHGSEWLLNVSQQSDIWSNLTIMSWKFQPYRGLRKGDPLSPYLFLICSEWFPWTLSHSTNTNKMEGIRICRGAPVISYLLFPDDSILFAKANIRNIVVLKCSLDEYQYIPRQQINFAKSEVVFSRNVSNMVNEFFLHNIRVSQVSFSF